jgi:hypothetical protein
MCFPFSSQNHQNGKSQVWGGPKKVKIADDVGIQFQWRIYPLAYLLILSSVTCFASSDHNSCTIMILIRRAPDFNSDSQEAGGIPDAFLKRPPALLARDWIDSWPCHQVSFAAGQIFRGVGVGRPAFSLVYCMCILNLMLYLYVLRSHKAHLDYKINWGWIASYSEYFPCVWVRLTQSEYKE